jgi:predicted helicase
MQEQTPELLDNHQALDILLQRMEEASLTARDKGTRFETLIKDWFKKERTYSDLFSKVQTYAEWAKENPTLAPNAKDIGIDLVATLQNEEGDAFAAIQCKFYAKDAIVPKGAIDSFIASSSKKFFKQRYLVATNETFTDNVRAEFSHLTPPVTFITRETLGNSMVDWAEYLKTNTLKAQAPRKLRPYQRDAVKDVLKGFETADRGKLIMACGSGKTYTSMKIAEEMEGEGGFVMFLVPSLALLSQTLSDWKQNCKFDINAFAVCSDTTIGKKSGDLDSLTSQSELSYPSTTDAESLAKNVVKLRRRNPKAMTCIFSTYQSIAVVSEAQKKYGMEDIGLVICDEAHRTCGGRFVTEEETEFTKIHSDDFIRARKRLYMTATPKIYGEKAKSQEAEGEVTLYSMDDETVFGKTFHTISFSDAVNLGCLVDYKVIVLGVEEDIVGNKYTYQDVENGGMRISDFGKVIGSWKALSKQGLHKEISLGEDVQPMKRLVGFAQVIEPNKKYDKVSSKLFANNFQKIINKFTEAQKEKDPEAFLKQYGECPTNVITRHIDGSMDATEKSSLLDWLRADVEDGQAKILFNVRCLSEGVDVPSLDGVIFLSPRKSQVDVVQTVGRVMRTAQGKQRGYVIIPIVTPSGVSPDMVLDNNKDFDTVWQILKALKSIDTHFSEKVDGKIGVINPDTMEVICISNGEIRKKGSKDSGAMPKPRQGKKGDDGEGDEPKQGEIEFLPRNNELEEAIKARIVKKVGNRREWEDWAEDVGEVCRTQIEHIHEVVNAPQNVASKKSLEEFTGELKATLNGDISEDDAIEMLGQHIVTKPILDALFQEYPFTEKNPISKALSTMLVKLDKAGLEKTNQVLKSFYDSVRYKAQIIQASEDPLASRQALVLELFDKFFKFAFPKMRDKLGIVYTPVQIVDFINQSVDDILKQEFGVSIADKNIKVLDPFVGTGTFLTRLLQSGLIPKDRIEDKFDTELFGNEIVPLAYYVASMNLEATIHQLLPNKEYQPNSIMVWTDTFADNKRTDLFKTTLAENNERLAKQHLQDIRVIIGNPPYSVGQESANDDNANEHYEQLDKRLAETYVANTDSTLKGKLYDSYIRAYRWASDRIGDKGVIGFVTNAGWLDSGSASGMRKCMVEEFSTIYVFRLTGNCNISGEQRRKEGGNVFGEGSRAPVAIVILVKNPDAEEQGKIYFHDVGDFLTREQKLEEIVKCHSVVDMAKERTTPDSHNDWFNQRDDSYSKFMRMDGKKTKEKAIFENFSLGLCTNRDVWCYNSSKKSLSDNMRKTIRFYSQELTRFLSLPSSSKFIPTVDLTSISWINAQREGIEKHKASSFSPENVFLSLYRPFYPQWVYFDRFWNNRVYQLPQLFPKQSSKNIVIVVTGKWAKEFSCLITNAVPCLDFIEKAQCFPRYLYVSEDKDDAPNYDLFATYKTASDGRKSAITKEALRHFREAYPDHERELDDDALFYYIYGILHSPDYRKKYANNLMKELPRIPRVATWTEFEKFSQAGEKLAKLHLNYEKVKPYDGVTIHTASDNPSYEVTKMRWGKIKGVAGNAGKDKTKLIYNSEIVITGIPIEAQDYVVNKRSALDWLVEKCCVSTDSDSGIVNNFNDYGKEIGNPKYTLELLLRIITVSLETMKIVRSLPPLNIHRLDK